MLGPIMKCGHAAQGKDTQTGKPMCIICAGAKPGFDEPEDSLPDLNGRKARCQHYGNTPSGENHSSDTCKRGEPCMCEEDSQKAMAGGLPFFQHNPHSPFDSYYCGCYGWE